MLGLAWANIISAIAHGIILHFLLLKKNSSLENDSFLLELTKVIAASIIMGCAAYSINFVVQTNFDDGKLADLISVGAGIPISMLAYFQALKLFKYKELSAFETLFNRFSKK